jgi:hypothetical protein
MEWSLYLVSVRHISSVSMVEGGKMKNDTIQVYYNGKLQHMFSAVFDDQLASFITFCSCVCCNHYEVYVNGQLYEIGEK